MYVTIVLASSAEHPVIFWICRNRKIYVALFSFYKILTDKELKNLLFSLINIEMVRFCSELFIFELIYWIEEKTMCGYSTVIFSILKIFAGWSIKTKKFIEIFSFCVQSK